MQIQVTDGIECTDVIYTAHLSTKRNPGAVFLVSKMQAGCAASAIAYSNHEKLNSILANLYSIKKKDIMHSILKRKRKNETP